MSEIVQDSWSRRVTLAIYNDAPASRPVPYASVKYRPASAVVEMDAKNGVWSARTVTCAGPRVKKDGSDGAMSHDERFQAWDRLRKGWPDWVEAFVQPLEVAVAR